MPVARKSHRHFGYCDGYFAASPAVHSVIVVHTDRRIAAIQAPLCHLRDDRTWRYG